ncbi:MAG: hypothetical protein SPI25_06125 [Dialister sp.]|nr:hypothetical protein [Dialister sp.]
MYDYRQAMKEDIRDYIKDNVEIGKDTDKDELESTLYDDLFIEDSVTGNASGSYTFKRNTARDYVTDNIDLLEEACHELGIDDATIGRWFLNQDFDSMDVTIRCHLLSECLHDVPDDITV